MVNRKKVVEKLTIAFVIIFLILFILSIIYAKNIENKLGSNLENYGAIILFFIAFFIELIPNYLAPHIGAINAAIIGISIETTISCLILGSIIGSSLGFEIGKKYGTKLEKNFLKEERIDQIENILNKKGRWGVSLAAISPLPYLPIVLGSVKFSRKNFFIYGIIPRTLGIILLVLIVYIFK